MEGIFVQTTLYKEDLEKIAKTLELRGHQPEAIGKQISEFEKIPLSYCSWVCEGYPMTYGNRPGVAFETDEKPIYVCPADVFELMRSGTYLPGHEQFLFKSVEAMIKRYPTGEDFCDEFRKFFQKLVDKKYYPNGEGKFSLPLQWNDYCLDPNWKTGYNEIAFRKPMKIKNVKIFQNQKELWALFSRKSNLP
jgi:hypothetical protein